jgi:Ca-activated chloride channel homolog
MRTTRTLLVSCLAAAIAAGCATRTEDAATVDDAGSSSTVAEAARTEVDLGDLAADAADAAAPAGAAKTQAGADAFARRAEAEAVAREQALVIAPSPVAPPPPPVAYRSMPQATLAVAMPAEPIANTENYAAFEDGARVRAAEQPVSTFSIDVDTGSYSNVRRMLAHGQLPPKDAVRVEEMLNYFDYAYPAPRDRREPFAVSTEVAPAPWDARRLLMHVGIQGYAVDPAQVPAANLVFLIDTSGSMAEPDKLPLLKDSFRQLVPHLRAQDRVAIVVYAGSAGLVLPSTPGDRHDEILAALDRLEAGGSTNGGEGIELAYAVAGDAFVDGGVNRIVLATDGDFNVGVVDPRGLETRVERGRKAGIALTTLGFGQGNYNDALAEQLADVGDGNHAYIDTPAEGRKVLVEEMTSTMMTIARDVKIQVEFDPAVVAEYRLIGYENRALAREDFNDDRVDAGEIGAGHDVTAIYELCLVGAGCESTDPLRYGAAAPRTSRGDELAWLKLRYKLPGSDRSVLRERPVTRAQVRATASEDLRFAAAVAAYADLLRGGAHVGAFGWDDVEALARGAQGTDAWGYRAGFLQLLARARSLSAPRDPAPVALTTE